MSFLESSSDITDHHPITKLLADHGTWKEWSVGCICGGFYTKGGPGFYIPAERSALRLYQEHLRACGIIEEREPDDGDEDLPELPSLTIEERLVRIERVLAVAWPEDPDSLNPTLQAAWADVLQIRKELNFPDDYDPRTI